MSPQCMLAVMVALLIIAIKNVNETKRARIDLLSLLYQPHKTILLQAKQQERFDHMSWHCCKSNVMVELSQLSHTMGC